MRIAVSGTHCTGKTTLIEAFIAAHPDFDYEPEPYVALVEDYGEDFSSEPSLEDYLRQLEFYVERVGHFSVSDKVIFERSPLDFLAYILALKDLKRDDLDQALLAATEKQVTSAMRNLDLIVFLPLYDARDIDLPEDEDPRLRIRVDHRLVEMFERFDVAVPEVLGTTEDRLRHLEEAMVALERIR